MQSTLGRDAFPHRQDRYRCVTRRQITGYAMSWRQQAPRPIQRRSWTGRMPLRGVLRPSRLPERNRHAGDLWRPNACLMTVWRQGEPASSRKRRAKGVSAIVLARDRSLGANVNVRALQAAQPWAHNSAADEPASEPPHIRAAHSHINAEQLASAAPSHWASADKHPRTPTIGSDGREAGAEGSMGRTGGWGGRKAGAEGSLGRKGGWGGREYGAERSMGRNGVWGEKEYGAERRLGRKGVWGGREYGAEGSMPALGAEGRHLQGRKLVWGGKEHGALRLGTPRHTNLHFDPQATTFLSPPGGIYLILRNVL